MTPNEQFNKIVGCFLLERGGLPYIEKLAKEYDANKNSRMRYKKQLLKCLELAKEG